MISASEQSCQLHRLCKPLNIFHPCFSTLLLCAAILGCIMARIRGARNPVPCCQFMRWVSQWSRSDRWWSRDAANSHEAYFPRSKPESERCCNCKLLVFCELICSLPILIPDCKPFLPPTLSRWTCLFAAEKLACFDTLSTRHPLINPPEEMTDR